MTALFEIGPGDVAVTSDDWYTPRWVFNAIGLVFDMDVSAPVAPEFRTCPARRYLTVLEDGLTQPWEGVVWCNPPYSNPRPWAERLMRHPTWIALVPASCNTWRGALTATADALALMSIGARNGKAWAGFGRPDGSQSGWPFALCLLGRGEMCIDAVARAAAVDPYAAGAYHVRPAG